MQVVRRLILKIENKESLFFKFKIIDSILNYRILNWYYSLVIKINVYNLLCSSGIGHIKGALSIQCI